MPDTWLMAKCDKDLIYKSLLRGIYTYISLSSKLIRSITIVDGPLCLQFALEGMFLFYENKHRILIAGIEDFPSWLPGNIYLDPVMRELRLCLVWIY